MASKRCLPTRFFKDPDIMNLANRDNQLILVGLVLMADDEGRELAHAKLLSRELDYPQEQIEAALADLAANDLVVLYQVGRHRYYSLTRWGAVADAQPRQDHPFQVPGTTCQRGRHAVAWDGGNCRIIFPEFPGIPQRNAGKIRGFPGFPVSR